MTSSLTLYGQESYFYNNDGSLKVDESYKIDTLHFSKIKQIESYLLSRSDKIRYPEITLERGGEGAGIIVLDISEENVSVNSQKSVDPAIDRAMKIVLQNLIDSLELNSHDAVFSMYIPYDFSIRLKEKNDSSSLSIVYPGERARMVCENLYVFEDEFKMTDEELIAIDNVLPEKLVHTY